MSRYRVCACSVVRPGTFLVQDEDGNCSVFFTRTGSLSATTLDPALTDAIVQDAGWRQVDAGDWLSLEELRNQMLGAIPDQPRAAIQSEA
jgi:hypothetical protein